tara:strand:- start:509 stop:1015 length:507 start_codon:yes stop_codon:yes gene_type:complete
MKNNLNTFPFFAGLSNKEIELFTSNMMMIDFQKNENILTEGVEGHSLLFVLDGKITISKALTLVTNKMDENDNREKTLTRLSSKDAKIMLGEIALFSPDKKRNATVVAIEDCKVAKLDFDKIFEICDKDNKLGYKIMKNLSEITAKNLIDSNHKVLKLTTAFSLLIDN